MHPNHELIILARHDDSDQAEEFLDAVGQAEENDRPGDNETIVRLANVFVNYLITQGKLDRTEREEYLTFVDEPIAPIRDDDLDDVLDPDDEPTPDVFGI